MNALLRALEAENLENVKEVMDSIPTEEEQLAVLCARSTSTELSLRTPLMAAAETGDLAIFSAVLDAFYILSSRSQPTGGHWVSFFIFGNSCITCDTDTTQETHIWNEAQYLVSPP